MVVLGVKCRGGGEGPVIEIDMDSGGAGSKVSRG